MDQSSLPTGCRAVLRDLAGLVVPVECPGCGAPDETVCPPCRATLAGPPGRVEEQVPRLDRMDDRAPMPVWAVAGYTGPVRGLVVSWKDRGRLDLTPMMRAALRTAADGVGAQLRGAVGPVPVAVVPVPPGPGSRRRRGADLVGMLAESVVTGLRSAGLDARVDRALRRRRSHDQVGLGARARGRNAAAGFVLRPGVVRPGRLHLLVDDVVTTGSTLATCEHLLTRAGAPVLGAFVLAATPAPADRAR